MQAKIVPAMDVGLHSRKFKLLVANAVKFRVEMFDQVLPCDLDPSQLCRFVYHKMLWHPRATKRQLIDSKIVIEKTDLAYAKRCGGGSEVICQESFVLPRISGTKFSCWSFISKSSIAWLLKRCIPKERSFSKPHFVKLPVLGQCTNPVG